jgi:hypothetical protein
MGGVQEGVMGGASRGKRVGASDNGTKFLVGMVTADCNTLLRESYKGAIAMVYIGKVQQYPRMVASRFQVIPS